MDAKIHAIGMTMARSAENLLGEQDGVKCFAVMAASIYTTHFKPLEDALDAAKQREMVMVEALEATADYIGDESCGSSEFWEKYRAALAKLGTR